MQQVIIVLADTTEQAEKNEEFIELVPVSYTHLACPRQTISSCL